MNSCLSNVTVYTTLCQQRNIDAEQIAVGRVEVSYFCSVVPSMYVACAADVMMQSQVIGVMS